MAVSSPGRKVQLTRLTATWPPKRMVRSRVSRVRVIRASSDGWSSSIAGVTGPSHRHARLDPRIHRFSKRLYSEARWSAGSSPAMTVQMTEARGQALSPLVADRNVHVLDLDLAHRLVDGPCQVRIDLDPEVIHALQRLVIFLAEDHLAFRGVELHAFHRADKLFGVGGFRLGDGGDDRHRRGEAAGR